MRRLAGAIALVALVGACDEAEVPSDAADAGPDTGADTGSDASSDIGEPVERGVLADTVVGSSAPAEELEKATNGVRGGGATVGGVDTFSMGYGAGERSLTLTWSGMRVENGPGVDFVVFENAFLVVGGPTSFMDLIVVEVSDGGDEWVTFPHDYLAPDELVYSARAADWEGFAGRAPVLYHEEDNPVSPFDYGEAGGDAFDLDTLPDEGLAGDIRRDGFTHLRLVAAAALTNPDTGEPFPHDPVANGPDIDGVYARYVVPLDDAE